MQSTCRDGKRPPAINMQDKAGANFTRYEMLRSGRALLRMLRDYVAGERSL